MNFREATMDDFVREEQSSITKDEKVYNERENYAYALEHEGRCG